MAERLHGTRSEVDLSLYQDGVQTPLGRIVTLYGGYRVGVLHRGVSDTLREELFYGLSLDKIINEKE